MLDSKEKIKSDFEDWFGRMHRNIWPTRLNYLDKEKRYVDDETQKSWVTWLTAFKKYSKP